MKAIVYTEYGNPGVLKLAEVEKPTPGPEEVLVKIHAASVNRTDCAMLSAKPFIMRFFTGLFRPKNPILGTEFAGEVVAVGNEVTSFQSGDRVLGFDDSGASSHAQYLAFSVNKAIATIPSEVAYRQAAASTEGSHYAYNFINKVSLVPGQWVLVNGATGAIGSAAVQILKSMGINIVAVCDTRNMRLVESLGANEVIDYTREDFTKIDRKFSLVFDSVGKSSFAKCKALLLPGGIYISSELGPMAQNVFYALLTPLFGGKKVIFPIPIDAPASLRFVKNLMQQGKFTAVVDREYPLEKIADAYQYVGLGQKTGGVVITIDHDTEN